MIDRVTPDMGRLGPVNDADAMATNILAVWNSDRGAMGEIAQAQARQYSWDRSMEALFGTIYRTAFARCYDRLTKVQPSSMPSFVPAE